MDLFFYSPQIRLKNPPANWPKSAKYEGIYPRMYRSIITSKEGQLHKKELDRIVSTFTCPECHGARLNAKIRSCLIHGKTICEVSDMPIPEAAELIRQIDDPLARDIKTEILKRMNALIEIGLSYLSLSRGTDTLSGGEAQRIKIARYINSPLTDMMYVLDEPSVGLHSRDIQNLKNSLIKLKEHGNTVMIVEHHREVIVLQRQAHAEHHDAQQGVHPAGFDHAERAGEEQGTGCHHDDDGGHVLAHKVAYFFQSFHVVSSFLFYRLFLHETSGMARCRNKKRLCLPL